MKKVHLNVRAIGMYVFIDSFGKGGIQNHLMFILKWIHIGWNVSFLKIKLDL